MLVISHSFICAATVPLKQTESFRGQQELEGIFKIKGTNTPPKHHKVQLAKFCVSAFSWAGLLCCTGRKGDVPRAVVTTTRTEGLELLPQLSTD